MRAVELYLLVKLIVLIQSDWTAVVSFLQAGVMVQHPVEMVVRPAAD